MIFSEMLCNTIKVSPEEGELEGDCCICKKHTTNGFKKKFSGNFTCAEYISYGEVICPECNYLVKNSNEYRRTMFLLTEDELIKFKKKNAKDIVYNLPDKPFYIYLTKTWQKIGWIRMNEVYNENNKNEINFLIDYDIVRVKLDTLYTMMDFIKQLRNLKIPKNVFETGDLEMHHYREIVKKFGRNKARDFLEYIKCNVDNPVWDLALYLED
ncbi:MAG: hypothetical protein IJH63_10045 [Methanobrevibacter sp.]|nr:hypothetical protein [Methanosphaera sp.]MBR0371039.1 hypothetical protein [Methanobrevibacter sp.]